MKNNTDTKDPLYIDENQTVWVDKEMKNLSLEEKIGQMFAIGAFSDNSKTNEQWVEKLTKQNLIGSVVFFKGHAKRQAELTNYYQSLAKVPLMIAMDAEWGVSMRLSNTPILPLQMPVAATNKIENSYLVSEEIAKECKRLGVHLSYSPIADVNINPANPIIGRRSFGEDKELVTNYSISAIEAYNDNNVLSCGKHFPGHGDTSQDSHKTLPSVLADMKRIEDIELYPFERIIDAGVPTMMVAHLKIPALEPNKDLPSSLSPLVIEGLLKEKMGYKGLIMSDALNMQGAKSFGTNVEINIQALKAGNDVLLYPVDIEETIEKIVEEIKLGKITEERIDHSVIKILKSKYWAGLNNFNDVVVENVEEDLNSIEATNIINKVAKESITLVKNSKNVLPLKADTKKAVANICFGDDKFEEFEQKLNNFTKVDTFNVDKIGLTKVKQILQNYDTVIVSVDLPYAGYKTRIGKKKTGELKGKINSLIRGKKAILNLLGDPYKLPMFGNDSNYNSILLGYKNSDAVQNYMAATIIGEEKPQGVLPVSVNQKYPLGTSLTF
ncbi:MAG: hypothetical protein KAG96_04605 [Ichthyobacteriaceae bacterium]|nr:hypothetical protein [Ichthyobacteriaceae bacterium]